MSNARGNGAGPRAGWAEPADEGTGFGGSGFDSSTEAGAVVVRPRVRPVPESERERATPWHVVLLDDDHHTYEYVIRMLMELFGHSFEQALTTARRVDLEGRAVCATTHRELAELKAEQIHAFGADPLSASSVGSMSAVIEPALWGDEEDSGARDGVGG
ncbi:MAG: ATP-dependent Clp protease adaptor ClpS [Phycisphaerales bacterium]